MIREGDIEADASIRALYIDDDETLVNLTQQFLETNYPSIDVETTTAAEDALQLIATDAFDAVVCDYQMPKMDGLDVLEWVRTEYGSDLPFILFTGRGRESVAIEALNLGADRYLEKRGDPTSRYGVLAEAIKQEVDHHRTQRRLQKREENLQITLESIGDAVITTDDDGRITQMNPVAESLTGWDSEDAVGRALPEVFEIISEATREPEPDPARKVLETGTIVGLANGTILVRKDGTERFIADSASPIESPDGETIGVVIVFRDITDEYRTQKRQRRQRRAIIDLAVDEDITSGNFRAGVRTITETAAETLEVDRVGIWLFEDGNSRLRNVDLYDRSTGEHESDDELTASEYPAYFEALESHRAVDAHEARTDPRTAELRDGYLEPLGITSMLDAGIRSGGDVIGIVCHEHVGEPREWTDDELRFAGEIADQFLRLRTNRQQRAYERALEELHNIATDITTFETPTGVSKRTIEVAETILEFDLCVISLEADGMLPIRALSEDVPPDGATTMSVEEGIVGKTYRTGQTYVFDDVRSAEDANPQGPYRSALSVPIGDHGVFQAVSGSVGAFDDDDVELAELLVAHAAQALDRLASEQELREQNERLEEFAGVLSHDLRNPLNVAEGRLELLADQCDSDHLAHIEQAHDRMQRLIEDLLELARKGQTVTEPGPVDLHETVAGCWHNVDTAEGTLLNEVDATIEADEGRVKQLLENLVRNAIEHGGSDVTVRVGELSRGFYVEDDGVGIPSEEHSRVFETGYTTSEDGTGFGLAIVKRIADAHGWDLTVTESAEGRSRFEIRGVDRLDR
ncbi:MAG: GAF domain-containing protein [Halobacteriota archaeon]